MASSPSSSSLLLPHGSVKLLSANYGGIFFENIRGSVLRCSYSVLNVKASGIKEHNDPIVSMKRRNVIGSVLRASGLFFNSMEVKGAGLPPEEKPKLCDNACEKELENVPMVTTDSGLQYKDIKVSVGPSLPIGIQLAANYVGMDPSGQIFDSSLEKGQLYPFRVGSGQIITPKPTFDGFISCVSCKRFSFSHQCKYETTKFPISLLSGERKRHLPAVSVVVSGAEEMSVASFEFEDFSVPAATIIDEGRALKISVEVFGVKTRAVFDKIFEGMVAEAQPIPGFRRVKGGKTPNIPKDILLEILGPSRVYEKVVKKVINSTVAAYVDKRRLKVRKELRIEQSFEDLEACFEPDQDFCFDAVILLQDSV